MPEVAIFDRLSPSVVVHVWCTPAQNCLVHGGFVRGGQGAAITGKAVEFGEGVSWREDRHLACESERRAMVGDDRGPRAPGHHAHRGSRLQDRVTFALDRPPGTSCVPGPGAQLDELDRLKKPLSRVSRLGDTRARSSSVRGRKYRHDEF